jgi:hypothetical protein
MLKLIADEREETKLVSRYKNIFTPYGTINKPQKYYTCLFKKSKIDR